MNAKSCTRNYACLAIFGATACGCAHEALDELAVERNVRGDKVCSLSEPDVSVWAASHRGCPSGTVIEPKEGSIQNGNKKEKEAEAL